jgi:hypothetical protein
MAMGVNKHKCFKKVVGNALIMPLTEPWGTMGDAQAADHPLIALKIVDK